MKRFEIIRKSIAIVLTMVILLIPFSVVSVNATTPGNCTLTKADGSTAEYATLRDAILAANSETGEVVTISVNASHRTAVCKDSDAQYTGSSALVINGNGNTIFTKGNTDHAASLINIATTASVTINSLIVEDDYTNPTESTRWARGIIRLDKGSLIINNSKLVSIAYGLPVLYIKNYGSAVKIDNSIFVNTANNTVGGLISTQKVADVDYTVEATNSNFIASGANEVQNCLNFVAGTTYKTNISFDKCEFYGASSRSFVLFGAGEVDATIQNCNFVMPSFSTFNKSYTALYLTGAVNSLAVLNTTFQGTSCIHRNSDGARILGDWSSNAGVRDNWARLIKSATVEGTGDIQCDATQYTVATLPEMEDGAAVRLNKDTSGIRFTTTVAKANDANFKAMAGEGGSVTYGTIFVLKSELEVSNIWADNRKSDLKYSFITHGFLDAMDAPYVDVVANQGMETDAQGNITYRAALKGIAAANYADDICAFAYVKVTYGDGNFNYFYSAFDHTENTRSIQYVAQQALADTTQTYTAAELEVLNAYAGVQS